MAPVELTQATAVLREASDLAELVPGWTRLAARVGTTPIQDAIWSAISAETVDEGLPLSVVVVGSVEEPRAIAPLARRGSQLELLGASTLSEPSELLVDDDAALQELAAGIAALRTPVVLHRLPADSPSIRALKQAFRPFGLVITRDTSPHAVIQLDQEWTKPGGRLSSRRASDMRRSRRRAEGEGEVEVDLLTPAVSEVDELLDEAFAIEARSWKGREGTALAMDAERGAFYRRFSASAAERGELRLAFLRFGDRRVAMQLDVQWNSRLWLLKIGHDDDVKRCSPGMLLLLEVVRAAAADGLEAVQLLGGVEPWTSMWTDDVNPCVTVAAYPPGVASLSAAVGHVGTAAQSRRARKQRG
jgi:CelD/BcsL family acetyltransferase involved in cellulose biosynthesis